MMNSEYLLNLNENQKEAVSCGSARCTHEARGVFPGQGFAKTRQGCALGSEKCGCGLNAQWPKNFLYQQFRKHVCLCKFLYAILEIRRDIFWEVVLSVCLKGPFVEGFD